MASFLERVKQVFGRESAELREALDEVEQKVDDDLTRREAALDASPLDRMKMLQDDMADNDAAFDALRQSTEPDGD